MAEFIRNIDNAKRFVSYMRKEGIPDNMIAGLGGNLVSETAHSFEPNQVQLKYLNDTSYNLNSCDDYVEAVDDGTWRDPQGQSFIFDRVGFGLTQLTSPSRKEAFWNLCQERKVSIADLETQFYNIIREIGTTGYANCRKAIKENWSIEECARIICTEFERPAKKDDANTQQIRIDYALQFYEEFVREKEEVKEESTMATYTNSPLVNYTQISPCSHARGDLEIDTIIIHCYVGQVTVERMGRGWSKLSADASATYGVAHDGKIGQYVDESRRPWTTGGKYTVNGWTGSEYDYRSITIEVACDTTAPYAITDAAMKSLIKLVADIAKRNKGIGKLKWLGDKTLIGNADKQNMVVHRWFSPKACPGDYIYNRLGYIADEANKLNGYVEAPAPNIPTTSQQTIIKHTVVKGETLSKIAAAYGVTLDAVIAANPSIVNPNKIYNGQVIDIPVDVKNIPTTYTVVKGDTLSGIGKKVGVAWKTIASLNGIKAPYIIRAGQVLKLS